MKKYLLLLSLFAVSVFAMASDFVSNGIAYNIVSATDKTVEVAANDTGYAGVVNIPATVTYKNRELTVVGIGKNAFDSNKKLTSVNIPSSVKYIGYSAFIACTGLTEINIPTTVDSIADLAFSSCTGVTTLYIPGTIKFLGNDCFRFMSSLTKVTIGEGLTTIPNSTFYNDEKLANINIPASVKTIGTNAFEYCYLDTLVIEDSKDTLNYTGYGESGFSYVKHLYFGRDVNMPNLWSESKHISKVTDLTVGANVTDITWIEPSNVSALTLYCVNPPKTNAFTESQYTNLIVNIPEGSAKAYQAADVWKNFWNLQDIPTSINRTIAPVINGKVEYYNLNGTRVENPQGGVFIMKSNGKTVKVVK